MSDSNSNHQSNLRRRRFEAIYHEHCDEVLAYLLRRTAAEDAMDAAAETWLVAWRRQLEIPEHALPWLLGTARKVLSNQRRSAGRRSDLLTKLSKQPPDPPLEFRHSGSETSAFEVLRLMNPLDQEILCLVAWEGLKPWEGAEVMGRSSRWFSVRLHRARQKFKKLQQEIQPSTERPSGAREVTHNHGFD